MDQFLQIIASGFLSIIVMFSPLIFLDIMFFNGKYTRKLFKAMGDLIEGAIMLVFRGIGAAFRGLWRGIWHGIRDGVRRNRREQNQRTQNQRIDHHHFIHREDE
ncbi:MAG: hypothetical protein A2Y82_00275 [Candidatus Buchananbacteria bacterium RBG_13_36_9]|uniref:Uncharacterized protein n=1 Tax=Candidatus Buchananbacteria bacterium RBG_13_36_9 TaxID=1797530 RepID=A0A1G1XND5_9BACT|nr:MAG: hypothetical protein A2Y82_00275 [Candidatus Buchananbacteria bacterium RBG_13_36_9]